MVNHMDLKKCQIFTPNDIVKIMLNEIGYTDNILDKKIIDNSCGDGSFLIEIVRRFLMEGERKKLPKPSIRKKLQECIYGYEIDEIKYNNCIENLNEISRKYKVTGVKWNVHCADGLKINNDGEFDYVVGNPPYVAYKDLSIEERIETKERFLSCKKGKFDYSYAFIEKGLSLLKDNGKMVMISPSNMFKTVFGYELRTLIKPHIIKIIDCRKENIFDKVLTSPAITLYKKNCNINNIDYVEGLSGKSFCIIKERLKNKWVFTDSQSGNKRFGDYFVVSNSIATLANKIFIHEVDSMGNIEIDGIMLEPEMMKTARSPRSEKYNIKQKIIFPYEYPDGVFTRMEESYIKTNYPNIYKFLLGKMDELNARDSDNRAKWYEFGRSQALAHLNQEKLMISSIVTNQVFVYDLKKEEIPYSGIYIIPKADKTLHEAKGILSSKEFYNYLMGIGIRLSGDSVRISSKDIENYRFEV